MNIDIEKNIPIPNSGVRDALSKMEVGDSFKIVGVSSGYRYAIAKQIGIKITARKVDDGIRVWRVK